MDRVLKRVGLARGSRVRELLTEVAQARAEAERAYGEAKEARAQAVLAEQEAERTAKDAARAREDTDRANAEAVQARDELAQSRDQLAQAREEVAGAREEADRAREEAVRAQRDAAQVHRGADRPGRQAPPSPAESEQAGDGPPPVVPELITLADRLVDLTGQGAPTDASQAGVVLRWLAGRAQAMLTACEVTQITDEGPVDPMRHEVVADRPATAEELAEHIAATVRPGYAWRGRLLRPQQVIAYLSSDS